jgi:hypothetical protein
MTGPDRLAPTSRQAQTPRSLPAQVFGPDPPKTPARRRRNSRHRPRLRPPPGPASPKRYARRPGYSDTPHPLTTSIVSSSPRSTAPPRQPAGRAGKCVPLPPGHAEGLGAGTHCRRSRSSVCCHGHLLDRLSPAVIETPRYNYPLVLISGDVQSTPIRGGRHQVSSGRRGCRCGRACRVAPKFLIDVHQSRPPVKE